MPNTSDYRDERANPNNRVLMMTRKYIGDTSALNSVAKYVCNRDLRILQTSQQLREEAGDVFYRANVFTLYLCMPDEAKLRSVQFDGGLHYVDLSRIRQCHISSAPPRFPSSNYDSKEESAVWEHLSQFAEALSRLQGHQMQYLLIECYQFEIATVGERRALFSLEYVIEDLNVVRGIEHVHIRSLNQELWPYLRDLERLMTSNGPSESKTEDIDMTSLRNLARIETHENRDTAADELFRRFALFPLYRNKDFVHVL